MLPSRGFQSGIRAFSHGRCRPIGIVANVKPHFTAPSSRHLSQNAPAPLRGPQLPWNISSAIPRHTLRFASTSTNPPAVKGFPSDAAPTVPIEAPVEAPIDDWAASLDKLTSSDWSPGVEHIGFLKQLGLDYGWGPTALIQTLLEHVHIYTGTPWWGSIAITAVLVRLVLLKFFVDASDQAVRMKIITPHLKHIHDKIKTAKLERDTPALMANSQELKAAYRAGNVRPLRMWLPPILSVPLSFGTFRLLRGMGDLPVPGLDEGGLLWIKDLTVADPFFILPIFTSFAFYYNFKKGSELGVNNNNMMAPALKNLMQYGLPAITGLFMLMWPSALQISFAITSIISMSQNAILRQPRIRDFFGIQPLPIEPAPGSEQPKDYAGTMTLDEDTDKKVVETKGLVAGTIEGIKGGASSIMKQARDRAGVQEPAKGKRLTEEEMRSARAYETRRKRELELEKLEKSTREKKRRKRQAE